MEEGGMTQEDFDRYLRERKQRDQEDFKEDFLDDFDRWKKHQKDRTVPVAEGGRIGLKKGSMRDRLQKDYKSYARLSDYLKSAPPKFWLSPEKYGVERDDIMTALKERFMYGDLDKKAEGGIMRIPFGLGSMSRRAFLKMMAAVAALPIVGKGITKVAPKVIPKVTETIVRSNAEGMPVWFPSLVRRVIKEGDDISKGAATAERQTVHKIKLPESGTPVEVTRDLVTDDVFVDIGMGKHGWGSGRHGQPTRLVLKKGEWIEPTKTKKGVKTKDEFFVEEAEFTGGHPENVKFEESAIEKYGDHASDFTEVEKYAVGKNIDKKIIGKKRVQDEWAEGRAEAQAEDIDDFASGGLAYMLGE